jgi:predicted RND superfamily exporter protein
MVVTSQQCTNNTFTMVIREIDVHSGGCQDVSAQHMQTLLFVLLLLLLFCGFSSKKKKMEMNLGIFFFYFLHGK